MFSPVPPARPIATLAVRYYGNGLGWVGLGQDKYTTRGTVYFTQTKLLLIQLMDCKCQLEPNLKCKGPHEL